jgi:hypothetical protein
MKNPSMLNQIVIEADFLDEAFILYYLHKGFYGVKNRLISRNMLNLLSCKDDFHKKEKSFVCKTMYLPYFLTVPNKKCEFDPKNNTSIPVILKGKEIARIKIDYLYGTNYRHFCESLFGEYDENKGICFYYKQTLKDRLIVSGTIESFNEDVFADTIERLFKIPFSAFNLDLIKDKSSSVFYSNEKIDKKDFDSLEDEKVVIIQNLFSLKNAFSSFEERKLSFERIGKKLGEDVFFIGLSELGLEKDESLQMFLMLENLFIKSIFYKEGHFDKASERKIENFKRKFKTDSNIIKIKKNLFEEVKNLEKPKNKKIICINSFEIEENVDDIVHEIVNRLHRKLSSSVLLNAKEVENILNIENIVSEQDKLRKERSLIRFVRFLKNNFTDYVISEIFPIDNITTEYTLKNDDFVFIRVGFVEKIEKFSLSFFSKNVSFNTTFLSVDEAVEEISYFVNS